MHHANLIIGRKEWTLAQVPLSDRTECADVSLLISDKFSIDDVRSLIYDAQLRPVERPYRSFVIQADQILVEAQNALLKLFEEPNAHTVFYLTIPREDMLLPTLRSRLIVYAREEENESGEAFHEFKRASYVQRLELIAEKLKEEDMEWVRSLVKGLSAYAHIAKDPTLQKDVLMLEQHIYTNGASKKMLLEHIALSV